MRHDLQTKSWKVSEVAELAHVTVRTLHHYDEIGLLVPSARSGAGYRLYVQADLERLHEILLYRELGFPLDGIAHMIDDPAVDRQSALRAQRGLLLEKRQRMDALIRAVDRALEAIGKGRKMSREEIFEGFDAFANAPDEVRAHQAKHGREALERWGGTDAHAESLRRARSFSQADWQRIKAEGETNEARMAELAAGGADPHGEEAMAGAEAMRQHIDRWFYPCSYATHAGLADMYEADARFRDHYEKRAPGLATFVATAIRANSMRARDEPHRGRVE